MAGLRRFQFSLATLFVVTTLVAIYFSIACSAGYIEAIGSVAALLMIAWAIRYRRGGLFLGVRILTILLAIGLVWMVAVDRSHFREVCPDCHFDRDIFRLRVYGISLWERTHEYYYVHRIGEDLGSPCLHTRLDSGQLTRVWGLILPGWPCFCGTLRLTNDEWYDDRMAEIVRAKGRESPTLGKEFHQRVFVEHDLQYLQDFYTELDRARAEDDQRLHDAEATDRPP